VLWRVPAHPGNPAQAQDARPGRARCRRRAGHRRHAEGSRPPAKKAKTAASPTPAMACCRRRQWPHQACPWQATQVRPAVHSETAARPERRSALAKDIPGPTPTAWSRASMPAWSGAASGSATGGAWPMGKPGGHAFSGRPPAPCPRRATPATGRASSSTSECFNRGGC
jgi:hypothetical protein